MNVIKFHQRPGESTKELAKRVANAQDIIRSIKAIDETIVTLQSARADLNDAFERITKIEGDL